MSKSNLGKWKIKKTAITSAPTSWGLAQDISFEEQVLRDLGVKKPTAQEVAILQGWKPLEGTTAGYNPWATTQNMPGATQFNSVGVKNFPTMAAGAEATTRTLQNGYYPDIVKALQTGNLNYLNQGAQEFGTWSGGGYGPSQIIQNAIAAEPAIQKAGLPAGMNPNVWKNVTMAPSNAGAASTGGGGYSGGGGGGVNQPVDTSLISPSIISPMIQPSINVTPVQTAMPSAAMQMPSMQTSPLSLFNSGQTTGIAQGVAGLTKGSNIQKEAATPFWMIPNQTPTEAPSAYVIPQNHPLHPDNPAHPVKQMAATHAASLAGAPISPYSQEQLTAVQKALGERGIPYVWGGTDPKSGLDCSGLVQYAWGQAGVNIPRTTYQQIASLPAAKGPLHVGDLIYPESGHVGMYIGDGKVIQAPYTGTTVQVSTLNGGWAHPYAVRRPDPNGALTSDPLAAKATVGVPAGASNINLNALAPAAAGAAGAAEITNAVGGAGGINNAISPGLAPVVSPILPVTNVATNPSVAAAMANTSLPSGAAAGPVSSSATPITNTTTPSNTASVWVPGVGLAPTSNVKKEANLFTNWFGAAIMPNIQSLIPGQTSRPAVTAKITELEDEEEEIKFEEPKVYNEIDDKKGMPRAHYASIHNELTRISGDLPEGLKAVKENYDAGKGAVQAIGDPIVNIMNNLAPPSNLLSVPSFSVSPGKSPWAGDGSGQGNASEKVAPQSNVSQSIADLAVSNVNARKELSSYLPEQFWNVPSGQLTQMIDELMKDPQTKEKLLAIAKNYGANIKEAANKEEKGDSSLEYLDRIREEENQSIAESYEDAMTSQSMSPEEKDKAIAEEYRRLMNCGESEKALLVATKLSDPQSIVPLIQEYSERVSSWQNMINF